MINPRLSKVCKFVNSWCENRHVALDICCDESDLQGVMLFRQDRRVLPELLKDLKPILASERIHFEMKNVRGGTILAFSVKSISESMMASIIDEAGEEIEQMDFIERVNGAFSNTVAGIHENDQVEPNFLDSATRIVESQYKLATKGVTRANQTSLMRQRIGGESTYAGPIKNDDPQEIIGSPGGKTRQKPKFEHRIMGVTLAIKPQEFDKQLNEALEGMATPSGVQPGDLFSKFAQSLSVLGQKMGTGPLQNSLKKQGIQWKKSDDGQSIILFVMNGSTNAPQPIARISAATLEKPSDFEAQLLNIMDFAKGEAPGTFKMQQQEMQQQEKTAREIARQLGPQDPNAITPEMMNGGGGGGMQQGQPQQQNPQQQNPQQQNPQQGMQQGPTQAANQAAMPKM